jgi:hypothetical protein
MSKQNPQTPLRIAVVGHTNTGKTSLLRTLIRDTQFGEVSVRPSTTRHVEGARLGIGTEQIAEFYDTPGIEEAIALLELLDAQSAGATRRLDGPARIQQFLASSAAAGRFEQEAKVLRQMLQSDAALYVIDARDPVLAKYRDELEILASCGVPILPLLNFSSDPAANESVWRQALGRIGLHVIVSFDTVAPAQGGERILYEKLATLLDARGQSLLRLAESHIEEAILRRGDAIALVAELLIDVAACRVRIDAAQEPGVLDAALQEFNQRVRAREQACVDALLRRYGFEGKDIESDDLPFSNGRWVDDLFDPASLGAMGISLGGGAAAGAAAGFGVDLMLGGASLGSGAAIGALLGGGLQTLRRFGRRIGNNVSQSFMGAVSGSRYLRIDDRVLRLLGTRALFLVQALEARGHAAVQPIAVAGSVADRLWQGQLPERLRVIREHTAWSGLYQRVHWDAGRQHMLESLAGDLHKLLRH